MDAFGAIFYQRREGSVDFNSRLARFRYLESPEFDKTLHAIERRFPWLDGEDDDDGGDERPTEIIYGDGIRLFGAGESFARTRENGEGAHPENPVWILEALDAVDEAEPAGEDFVRGYLSKRYELHASLASGADVGGSRTLRGSGWIDEDGLIRRVTWRFPPYGRPRLERLKHRRPAHFHVWSTCELWDFGVPGPVELPAEIRETADEPVSNLELAKTAAGVGVWVWKQRRAWRLTHPAG